MDDEREKAKEKLMEPLRKQSDFMKVLSYNHPKWIIVIACISVAAAGFCQPLFGWIFAEMMQVLTVPIEGLKMAYPDDWKERL